jgi:hypothetical protein
MRKPNVTCCTCGKPKYVSPSVLKDGKRYFCAACAEHKTEREYRTYIERWLRGEEAGMRGTTSISRHVRRWLLSKHNHRCSLCAWSATLEVHHVDGNHTNCRPENLNLLCPNHHSVTPNYRARNSGNGRPRK